MTRNLPPSASIAHDQTGGKLHAPSAERNVAAITQMLCDHAPTDGDALEIASGTGQHVIAFARALPKLRWHPTEIDASRRASIDAYVQDAGLDNIASARALNATAAGWGRHEPPKSLIFLSNLLHLISAPEAETLITEAAQALKGNGSLILYGPFKRGGQLTSDGDRRFDADLRAADPAIGYKDVADVTRWMTAAGLGSPTLQDMPANNLALIATKAAL